MRAPAFWWRPPGLAARALQPISSLYGAVAGARMACGGVRAPLPVICLGNVTVGGAGKTPAALATASILRELGRNPAFLLRGYGSRLPGPVQVDPGRHDAGEVGDEALLLARHGPTIVSRDRPAGAALCAAIGADVVVMDDGLQNPGLEKDLAVAVFDGEAGIGNGLVLPSGPLRAPMEAQWPRIGGVLAVGSGAGAVAILAEARRRGLPAFSARLVPDPSAADVLRGRRVLAFAGIGRPEKFFATLREVGAEVVAERPFPDHHRFAPADLAGLAAEAARQRLSPVTTEKDAVRLGAADVAALPGLLTLPVALAFDEPDRVRALLAETLARGSALGGA